MAGPDRILIADSDFAFAKACLNHLENLGYTVVIAHSHAQVVDELADPAISTVIADGGLNGGAVSDGLIGVDGAVELLAVEEVLQQLANFGDTSGTTDENDFVDGALGDLGVADDALDGVDGAAEEVHAQLLELGAGDLGVEVGALKQGVNLDISLSRSGE